METVSTSLVEKRGTEKTYQGGSKAVPMQKGKGVERNSMYASGGMGHLYEKESDQTEIGHATLGLSFEQTAAAVNATMKSADQMRAKLGKKLADPGTAKFEAAPGMMIASQQPTASGASDSG